MSRHAYETGDGTRYRVRWRDHNGKMRSKTLRTPDEARRFDRDIKARKQRLEALPLPTFWTLDYAWDEWRSTHGEEVAFTTLDNYETLWNAYVRDGFGATRLSHLIAEPILFSKFSASLKRGDLGRKVGDSSRRKLLMIMSGVLKACVEWGKIPFNPVRDMRKPPAAPKGTARAFSPLLIERIRAVMLSRPVGRGPAWRPESHAALVTLMAYAGLRPQEALALTFDHIATKRVAVKQALTVMPDRRAHGEKIGRKWEVGPTKTRKERMVPLADAVRSDLTSLRKAMGDPPARSFIFPAADEGPWSKSAYSNWRSRVWRPSVELVAATTPDLDWIASSNPYDCRRSFVSLQLRAGVPPLEVARAAGHADDVMFRHYSAVIEDLVDEEPLPADEQISRARKVIREEFGEALRKHTTESLKPPNEADPASHNLLYGVRRPISRKPREA